MLRYGQDYIDIGEACYEDRFNAASRASQMLLSLLVSNWKSQPLELRGCFRQVRPLPCRADHTRVKQSEIDHPFVTLVSRRG